MAFALTLGLPTLTLAQAPPPLSLTVFSGTSLANLQWSASPGAAGYHVLRSGSSGGPYALITNVSTTSFIDTGLTNGVAYHYVVAAVSNSVAGANSPEAAAIPIADGFYTLLNRLSGLALDDPNGAGTGGVVQQPYSGSNQVWRLLPIGSGVFAILSGASSAALSGQTPSAQLTLNPYLSFGYQFWIFQVTNGSYYLVRNLNTGQVMDDFANSTNAGTVIGQWVFNGSVNQQWTLQSRKPQLASVALTNDGALPQYTFTGTVDPVGLPTTLICQLGTNTSYGVSVTNVIAATNSPVNFSVTVPYTLDRATTMHGLVTASNGFHGVSSGDLTVSSIRFEARFTAEVSGNVAWMDVNEDGYLDLAANGGTGGGAYPRSSIWLNPGPATNASSWVTWVNATRDGAGHDGCIAVGDLNLDNRPDAIFAGGRFPIPGVNSPEYASSGIWYSGMPDRTHFRVQSPIGGEMVGIHAVIADFDHSGKPGALLSHFGGNYMLQGFLVNPVSPLLSLGSLVDGSDVQGSLTGGFLGTNGFMDVYAFNPDGSKTGTFHRNDGELGFTVAGSFQLSPSIGDYLWSSANSAWADFNGDGFDDILVLVSGRTGFTNFFLLNDGHGNFTNAGWDLPNWCLVNVGVGDLFHHGRPDIVMTGANHTGIGGGYGRNITVLRNDGNGVFTPVDYGLDPKSASADQGVALADFDNDGRLDITISGSAPEQAWFPESNSTCVYRNLLDIPSNAPPTAPTALGSSVSAGRVDLSWGAATDDVTPVNQLTYNVRIGTNSLGTQIVSPLANVTNGWRKVAARGNVGPCLGTYWHLPPGTYYWSVQAIDGAFAGGAWAAEQTFTITAQEKPKLSLANSDGQKSVRWPSRFNGFQLEHKTALGNTTWTNSPEAVGTHNGKWSVTVTNPAPAGFYRLRN
jgi:hypothetical protein